MRSKLAPHHHVLYILVLKIFVYIRKSHFYPEEQSSDHHYIQVMEEDNNRGLKNIQNKTFDFHHNRRSRGNHHIGGTTSHDIVSVLDNDEPDDKDEGHENYYNKTGRRNRELSRCWID
jgi:hypothetical protein